jgi:hypothetical protein
LAQVQIMRRKISLAELLRAKVTLTAEEAVAVVQQLIQSASNPSELTGATRSTAILRPIHATQPRAATVAPAYGPPSLDTVFLETDGRVTCAGCDVTPAVSEVGRLLQHLLPPEGVRIAGSLRYTIARAMLEVDAAPFDSLSDFSDALARHERGPRVDRVRRVLDRARAALARQSGDTLPAVDRRRLTSEIFELRRQLRESDERVYDQQRAIDALVAAAGTPATPRRHTAAAAGLAIGVMLFGVGGLMETRHPVVQQRQTVAAAGAADTEDEIVLTRDAPEIRTEAVVNRSNSDEGGAASRRDIVERASRRPPAKAAPRTEKSLRATERSGKNRNGVLDRLHLSWLRGKIAIRRDDL